MLILAGTESHKSEINKINLKLPKPDFKTRMQKKNSKMGTYSDKNIKRRQSEQRWD